jgi:hypothetical protein
LWILCNIQASTTPATPTFSVAAGAATVTEGGTATFTVSMSPAQATATTVAYALAGTGGAVLGTDTGTHTPGGSSGTLTFAAGESSKTISIPVTTDMFTAETGEGVSITLSSPSTGASLGTSTAAFSIAEAVQLKLTTSSDLITGTADADTINGLVGTNAQTGNLADTLQSVDIIDGAGGNDTLLLSIASAAAAVAPTVASVETINFTGFVAVDFNMANVTGTTLVNNTGSIVDASFTNVGSQIAVGIKDVNNAKTTVSYSATVNTALTDALTLNLNNVTNEAKITLTGDKKFSFDDTDGTNAMVGITTIDATGLNAVLDADLRTGGAVNLDIKSGSSNDIVIVDNFTKDDKFDLGGGTGDALTIRTAGALTVTTDATLTGVEVVSFSLDTNDSGPETSTVSMGGAASLTTVKINANGATGTDVINVTNLAATAVNLEVNGGGAAAASAVINTAGFALKSASGTSDALTITVINKDASGNAVVPTAKSVQLSQAITANGIETLTVAAGTLGANGDNKVANTADGGYKLNFTGDELKTLTVTSTTLVDMVTTALDNNLKTLDASGATGGFTADLSLAVDASTTAAGGTAMVTVTDGAGMDFIKTINGTGNYTVSLHGEFPLTEM